jgi:hypothetical protein
MRPLSTPVVASPATVTTIAVDLGNLVLEGDEAVASVEWRDWWRRGRLSLVAVLLPVMLVGCSTSDNQPEPHTGTQPGQQAAQQPAPQQPGATTEADWSGVAQALGRPGKLTDTVYRVALPRSDLSVVSRGVSIKPGLALGGYAVFTRYPDTTMLMGDLVVTEAELPRVTDALLANRIDVTGLHKHLLDQSPAIWWMHIHGMGDPVQLAKGVRVALDVTATPPVAPSPGPQPTLDLDTAGIDAALGRKGTADGGVYKVSIPRGDTIVQDGHVLPAGLGLTTAVNFQPAGGGKAAINGDFAMTGNEVQKVIAALRQGGIEIVEVHNHSLAEQPRLFYMHFWAVNDAVALARALRPALDATNLKPAS